MSAISHAIPWEQLKMDYISGFQSGNGTQLKKHSYDSIARKYNVSSGAVASRGGSENWKQLRDSFDLDVNEFVLESLKTNRINQITTLDDNLLTNIKMIQSIATQKLLSEDKITGTKTLKINIGVSDLQKITAVVMNLTTIRKQLFSTVDGTTKSDGITDFNNMMTNMAREREDSASQGGK
jgi:hypothetical protein